jgi:hypothetical protein
MKKLKVVQTKKIELLKSKEIKNINLNFIIGGVNSIVKGIIIDDFVLGKS